MCFSHRMSKESKERMKELRKARRAGGRDAAERREGNEKAMEFKLWPTGCRLIPNKQSQVEQIYSDKEVPKWMAHPLHVCDRLMRLWKMAFSSRVPEKQSRGGENRIQPTVFLSNSSNCLAKSEQRPGGWGLEIWIGNRGAKHKALESHY